MKHFIYHIKQLILLLVLLCGVSACMDYTSINTPEYLPTNVHPGTNLRGISYIAFPLQENNYQYCQNLLGDPYGRYMSIANTWSNNFSIFNAPEDWINAPYERVYGTLFPNWVELTRKTKGKGYVYELGKLLKVAAMQRMTDLYGPLPYSQIGTGSLEVAYDSQQDIYNKLFEELDETIEALTALEAGNTTDLSMKEYDDVYKGEVSKWIKYANALKLRMAMRIVYADPELAKEKAEEAVSHSSGIISMNDENAAISYNPNPIKIMWDNYTDSRVCADIVAYMNGYNDPRRAAYFQKSKVVTGLDYHGLRTGVEIPNKDWALKYSAPAIYETDKVMWLNAAEVAFLRAEGAWRGWAMGGTAQHWYEEGIRLSFDQYSISGADSYIANGTNTPGNYPDPTYGVSTPLSKITIQWKENDNDEQKLERIITQKWIAMWPLGQEAWSEHRRTGYPRFYPVLVNKSDDASLTKNLASRIPFPPSEKIQNATNYAAALTLLGGTDNYSTKLWWDKKTNKP